MIWTKGIAAAAGFMMLALGPTQADDTVTFGSVGESSVNNWPSYISISKGYFQAAGIKPDSIFPPSSSNLIQQLTAGSLNMALSAGLVDPMRAIDKGAPIAIVGVMMQAPPYALLAKPQIKSLADLKGKLISVGGERDLTRIFLERMLVPNGLVTGNYDLIFAGATGARFAALRAGAVDAAILLPPFINSAESAGFKNLGLTIEYVKDLPFSGSVVNRAWAAKHPDVLKRVIEANQKGMKFLLDPRNREESIAIFAKYSKLSNDDVTKGYDFLIQQHDFFDPTGRVSRKKFDNLANVLKQLGDIGGSTSLDRFVLPGVTQLAD
jgi:ABC-type nitrate/sulfonate/bicarbonate transport system substrate-binding protein